MPLQKSCVCIQPSYEILSYAPICNVAVLAFASFSLFANTRRRWSVNLAGAAVVAAMVVTTTSLLLSGFTHNDAVTSYVVVDGQVAFVSDPDAMSREYLDEDPGKAALVLIWGSEKWGHDEVALV